MAPELLMAIGAAVVLGGWVILVNRAQRDNKEADEANKTN